MLKSVLYIEIMTSQGSADVTFYFYNFLHFSNITCLIFSSKTVKNLLKPVENSIFTHFLKIADVIKDNDDITQILNFYQIVFLV